MVGLCLVAVFAIASVAATSASALPEWGQCFAKAGGKYADSNCQKKAALGKGTFEWRKGTEVVGKHFSGENLGAGGVLSTELHACEGKEGKEEGLYYGHRVPAKKCVEGGGEVGPAFTLKVECESESNKGETAGSKEVKNVSITFLGCKLFGSAPCSNGTKEGEIQVNALKGSLGYINKKSKEVGLLLEPVIKHGEFAKFNCIGIETVVGVGNSKEGAAYSPETTGGYDGIISPITPVNTMTTAFTQVYTINEKQENIPSHFEGKHIELLEDYIYAAAHPETEGFMWSRAGEEITNVNHPEEPGEIKA
jgi:hypothetical protein